MAVVPSLPASLVPTSPKIDPPFPGPMILSIFSVIATGAGLGLLAGGESQSVVVIRLSTYEPGGGRL